MFKRGISLLMVLILLLGFSISSYADPVIPTDKIVAEDNSVIQPLYDYITNYGTSLSISSGTAKCNASLSGKNGTTTKIVVKMTLQKKTLLWWSEVETWSATYNTYCGTLSKSTTVDSGTYRVKVVYTVYSGSNSESITDYSSQYKY